MRAECKTCAYFRCGVEMGGMPLEDRGLCYRAGLRHVWKEVEADDCCNCYKTAEWMKFHDPTAGSAGNANTAEATDAPSTGKLGGEA